FLADPNTGVWVADTYNLDPSNPWEIVGGTSLSAPVWAGMLALANQGRVAAGGTTLNTNSPMDTQTALYSLPASDYHSITSGSNGNYTAAAGYNLVTGLGTPVGNVLVPGLVAYSGATIAPSANPPITAASLVANGSGGGGTANAIAVYDSIVVSGHGGMDSRFEGLNAAATEFHASPGVDAMPIVSTGHDVTTTASASGFGLAASPLVLDQVHVGQLGGGMTGDVGSHTTSHHDAFFTALAHDRGAVETQVSRFFHTEDVGFLAVGGLDLAGDGSDAVWAELASGFRTSAYRMDAGSPVQAVTASQSPLAPQSDGAPSKVNGVVQQAEAKGAQGEDAADLAAKATSGVGGFGLAALALFAGWFRPGRAQTSERRAPALKNRGPK
ncbi:MAG TPA: hypothetical protein VFA18_13400, partial [Gemmataceae bacterium]|nr:hypothetical protein [Gemmataceae bacterium]